MRARTKNRVWTNTGKLLCGNIVNARLIENVVVIVCYLFKPNTTIHKLQLCVRSALTKIDDECNDTWRNEMERDKMTKVCGCARMCVYDCTSALFTRLFFSLDRICMPSHILVCNFDEFLLPFVERIMKKTNNNIWSIGKGNFTHDMRIYRMVHTYTHKYAFRMQRCQKCSCNARSEICQKSQFNGI